MLLDEKYDLDDRRQQDQQHVIKYRNNTVNGVDMTIVYDTHLEAWIRYADS